MAFFGGAREVQRLDNCQEVPNLMHFHGNDA
jgi:hypothetical protein